MGAAENMTERLADIGARVEGVRQLGAVVNAMRGIAAARVQQARGQLVAVDGYAATIAAAIGRALALFPAGAPAGTRRAGRLALVLFCAEQGFAGAFSERVLDFAAGDLSTAKLFLIGTRGVAAAAERGLVAGWQTAMPAHTSGIPRLADRIAAALYASIAAGEIDRLDAIFSRWRPGDGSHARRARLLPVDPALFPRETAHDAPLTNLPPDALLNGLTADFLHARLCDAALHAFAAENEARMQAMESAREQIERQLSTLRAVQRRVRQEEITSEIIELAAGESASEPEHA
jgi:F-type H+-transporting ATPase subunit gamma